MGSSMKFSAPLATLLLANLISLVGAVAGVSPKDGICRADCSSDDNICTFHARVDLHAGELGYYTFEECGDAVNPTLGMEVGVTYHFVQADRSNYYHPLGFAYYPDGAHADVDELEPGIVPPGSNSACAESLSCHAPMYLEAGRYLGTYSNDENTAPLSEGEDNFGLDDYEPKFFHPLPDWDSYGPFSITLKLDDTTFSEDIFYFCHIHQYMTGRIKLLKDDVPIKPLVDLPAIDYEYDKISDFDSVCGTHALEEFQLPHPECPEKFVCNVPGGNTELRQFANCIDAMDCHMIAGMTTGVSAQSEMALFIHQMIPHHQNAVNMAKALLRTGSLNCDSFEEESDDCAMEVILREIINGQNHQIQTMRALLESQGYPETDDCQVPVSNVLENNPSEPEPAPVPVPEPGQVENEVTTSDVSGRYLRATTNFFSIALRLVGF